jgi:peptidoglycan/LPS O-acetylase OafA/YrhL
MNGFTLFHIAAGSIGLLSGAAALSVRKGGRLHARAGTAFFAAMLAMAGTGAAIAVSISERGTAVVGIFTFYLVATSWVTARRRDGRAGGFERAGLAVALACGAAMLAMGLSAANSASGKFDSLPAAAHYPFAFLGALAAGLDLNFILRGRLERHQRIARHLWRMCAALAIAAFSFFLGQQDEFPAAWRGLAIWFVPPVAVLAAMVFWLVRVRFTAAFGRRRPAPQTAYQS